MRRRLQFAAAVFAALVVAHAVAPAAATKASAPTDVWYGTYFDGMPIGGSHDVLSKSTYQGRPCLVETSTSHTVVRLLGVLVIQDAVSTDISDLATGKPLSEVDVMSSGGDVTRVTAAFADSSVKAVLESGGTTETRTLTVPTGAVLMAEDPTTSPPTDLTKKYVFFDPTKIALDPVSVAAAPGQPKSHLRKVIVSIYGTTVTVEQDADGTPTRIDLSQGLVMVRRAAAIVRPLMALDASPTTSGAPTSAAGEAAIPDFAVVTSVVPTGAALTAHPTHMVVTVTEPGQPARSFDIAQIAIPTTLPIGGSMDDIRGRSDLARYLENTPYLDLDDPGIADQARELANASVDPYDIAVHIQQWVHDRMVPNASIGVPRTAGEIMGDRRGVCRDYAILYTALARKAGVPTRLCAGLVGFQGRFYYHAWAESFIGGSIGWMPFDPTLNQLPADASHIPLVKGDPANLFDLMGNIGSTKVVIHSCE